MSANEEQNLGALLRELKDKDGETGLLTASRLYRVLLAEVARSERYHNPLSCILLRFRGLDAAPEGSLRSLAVRLADAMRNTDSAAAWSDHEFLLVLPETGESGAHAFAKKIDQAFFDLVEKLGVEFQTSATAMQKGDDADRILERLSGRGTSLS